MSIFKSLLSGARSLGSSFISKIGSAASSVGNFVKNLLPKPRQSILTPQPIDAGWYGAHHGQKPSSPIPPLSSQLTPEQFVAKYSIANKMQNLGFDKLQPAVYVEPKKISSGKLPSFGRKNRR
jgi:hypothetical protein